MGLQVLSTWISIELLALSVEPLVLRADGPALGSREGEPLRGGDALEPGEPCGLADAERCGSPSVEWPASPSSGGLTALHFAAERGHTSMVRLLLSRRATPELQHKNGQGPSSDGKLSKPVMWDLVTWVGKLQAWRKHEII